MKINSIEPIAFSVEGDELDLPNYSPKIHPRASNWDETHDYILYEAATDFFNEFSMDSLRREFESLIEEKSEVIKNQVPELAQNYQSFWRPPYGYPLPPVYFIEDVLVAPNTEHNGYFYMLSNNKEKLRDMKSRVIEKIQTAPETYGAMGLNDISVYSGSDFTQKIISDIDTVLDTSVNDFDNDFEEAIYNELEPMSEAFINNLTVSFDSPQEPEYDILFSLGPGNTVSIEVEDHSGSDSEPSESDVIDNPSSEATYIDAENAFTVVKGVSSDKIGQFRQKAELTNVIIIENEQCPDRILEHINNIMLSNALNLDGTPGFR